MLRAYFDDSGTHRNSKIVVVAGIMGTNSELLSLEGLWREQLERPLDGLKSPVSEFRSYDCFESIGNFSGWKRKETDFFRHQLREVIIRSHVSAYGCAHFKDDWNRIIHDELRDLLGSAEGSAVRNCFVRSLRWAEVNCYDQDMEFIFDNSNDLERKRDIHAVYDAFRRHNTQKHLSGIAFRDSHIVPALQAADLFAWEFNRNARSILESGMNTPSTSEYIHLGKKMKWLDAQIARADRIEHIRDFTLASLPTDIITQMSSYFKNFAPIVSSRKGALKKRLSRQSRRRLKDQRAPATD